MIHIKLAGCIIQNTEGKILLIHRNTPKRVQWEIPGGNLELGETFENTAIRELKEEADIVIKNPKVIAITNNLETHREEGIHYISVILLTKEFSGEPKIMEPERCEKWLWCNPKNLPEPHFDASRLGVECFIKNKFYIGLS
ncbi:MAG: NUDIX domain-containing protein [Patescibacteria group bacterium]|nr:NUDIX domain-containing protein [Patescibacteria group bacterium]